MSKNIAVSDEVYWLLKREKGDRSFSEVIADRFNNQKRIVDVAGMEISAEET